MVPDVLLLGFDAASQVCTSNYTVTQRFFPTQSFGKRRSISLNLSSGAAISPATVSKGGLSGAAGWLRVGTNILVRLKLRDSC